MSNASAILRSIVASIALSPALHAPACADTLDVGRLFAAPDLSGPTLRAPLFSPDGRLVAYLRSSADSRDRLELWAYDIAAGTHRRLVDPLALVPADKPLSAEEAARRERQRTSAFSGIVDYQFAPDSHGILLPLGGDLYVYDLSVPPRQAVRRLTTRGGATDPRFSPRGHFVSFIRDQNLYVYDLASGEERRITPDCHGLVSCGVAEFVAQEEMDRQTGYWWSPDESLIAWTRVDEAPVAAVQRFEIYADTVRVVEQRYPAAGAANAAVQLFVSAIAPAGPGVEMDLKSGAGGETYLARVNWFPDSRSLAVQRQSRDQKSLELLRVDAASGHGRVLLTEHSDTWVDLNDELTFIPRAARFLWASSRSGYLHLYLYDLDGHLVRPVTHGDWMVLGDRRARAIRGVDAKRGLVYFSANRDSPIERHLYVTSFRDDGTPVTRITREHGWHATQMAAGARAYLDRYSSVELPPAVTLHAMSGDTLAELAPNRLDASHPYFRYLDSRPAIEFGTLAADDGQTLHYRIAKPRHLEPGRRYPVIVEVYGGPGVQSVVDAWMDQGGFFEQILTERGYVVFQIDNRGSGERGVRFEGASYRQLGLVEVRDQVRGAEFLKGLPYVDPARIGMFGWSFGGYLTLMCLMQAPDEFAAGVAGAPVTDWRLYDTHYTERYMGTPQDNVSGYEVADVLTHAAKLKASLLLMHGMADDNVLFTNSTALMKRLEDLRKPFELMTYPGAKHGLLRHADAGPHAYETILRFFDGALAGSDRTLPGNDGAAHRRD